MPGHIRCQRDGPLATLLFDHPGRRNAITKQMWCEIPTRLQELAREPQVRVVRIRGQGTAAFTAGADLSEFEDTRMGSLAAGYERATREALRALAEFEKPILAVVHGACFGGGMAIALAADLRLSSDDAQFAVPSAKLGVGYPPEAVQALLRATTPSVAKEMLFTGERYTAHEALARGVVDRVVACDRLDAEADELARRIASNAPLSVACAKISVDELSKVEGDLRRVESAVQACLDSADYAEGVRAFLAKRPPHFRGC